MNGSHFMVMAATGHGWLQVSPMFSLRDNAEQHMWTNLADGRMSIAKQGAKAGKEDISGKVLRVFEVL